MIPHLLSSTITALVAVAAVFALRRDRAAWRHAILLAAILRFAVPTEWVRVVPPTIVQDFMPALLHPGAMETVTRAATPVAPVFDWRVVWIAGMSLCLIPWARRVLRRTPAVRQPTWEETQMFADVPLRIVSADHVPGACGLFRQHVVLPDGLAQHVTESELKALVAHEMAHVRRRDNLTAALARVVASVFWFHPLVWWMERRMLAERETACDEAVLGQGIGAQEYVSGIAKVCRMSFAAATAYAGVNGSNLHRRMEHIMFTNLTLSPSRALRVAATGLIAIATLLPIAGGRVRAQPAPRAALVEAERLMSAGRTEEAVARLQVEIAKNPSDGELQKTLGNFLVRAGRFDAALGVYAEMMDGVLDANLRADLYLRMGETRRRKGDLSAAILMLQKARELSPENAAAVSTLALVLDQAGRHDEAKQLYRDAARLDQRNGIALNNLAYLITEENGDLNEALTLAKRAYEVMPNSSEVVDTLGWIHLKRGELSSAVQRFASAVSKEPGRGPFRTHLMKAIEQAGNMSAAAMELRLLLLGPSSPDADRRIAELAQSLR